jgi:hypothetical protein
MIADFGAIESVVGLVGAAAAGGALAVRVYGAPGHPARRKLADLLRRGIPPLAGLVVLLAVGAFLNWTGRGIAFEEGLLAGGFAAAAAAWLDTPGEPDGPGPLERSRPAHRAVAGIGAAGLSILAVLGVLLLAGPSPTALLGIPVGAGVLLLLGEPADRGNGRLRFLAVTIALAASTAYVANAVLLRAIVPNALLLPLLVGATSTVAGVVGVVVDRVEGPYRLGVPAATITGVVLAAVAVADWMPGAPAILLAISSGWLGAATVAYLPRWAVLEPSEAAEVGRAGTALGVIGSLSGGLRAAGAAVLAFGVAVWVAFAAVRLLLPDGTFGVALAATAAAAGAAGLAAVRVGTGPRGTPRPTAEALDVGAVGWAGLAMVFALPVIVPTLSGIPSEVFGAQLGLSSATTLSGLVLGATLPFLLVSASRRSGATGTAESLRRWCIGLAPAFVAIGVLLILGPAAAVALVLGAVLTGTPLGLFWASSREAAASIRSVLPNDSGSSTDLAGALDAGSGWRISAAVLATGLAVLALVVIAIGARGHFGL